MGAPCNFLCGVAMSTFEQHCQESIRLFGQAYGEVHRYLDEFAGKLPYGMRHRKKRHHLAGIAEVVRLFGKKAGEAARQHIVTRSSAQSGHLRRLARTRLLFRQSLQSFLNVSVCRPPREVNMLPELTLTEGE